MSKLPKFLKKIVTILFLLIYGGSLLNIPVYSNEISDLEKQISEKSSQIDGKKGVLATVESKIKEISSSNYSVTQKINLINEEIAKIQASIDEKDAELQGKIDEIAKKQQDLLKKKELLDEVSSQLYMKSRNNSANFFLSFADWNNIVENFFVKRNAITILKEEVEKISGEFIGLEEAKADLNKQKEDLDKQKSDLDTSYKLLAEEKSKLQKALGEQYSQKKVLSAEITDLNAKMSQLQSALIAARSAGLIYTGGYTGAENGTAISQAPANSFGIFSIGAYTHRNGMSQWGAKARAEAGQSYIQILNAYYPGKNIANGRITYAGVGENITGNISVDGYGSLSLEDYYLLGIKEVPESWPMEVLKAQAIAARTYAVNYTQNGRKSICTTEKCQVFNLPLKSGAWVQAVRATRGMVLTNSDGTTTSTQFAAVHGGWGNTVGWDTVSGNGNDWFNDSWERKSGVTWFYKSWYINGYSSSGESCGHSPFLSHDEMAMMINSYFVKNGIGVKGVPDKSRLLPSDYGRCPGRLDYGRTDKTPYTLNEVKSFLVSPVHNVYSASTALEPGRTASVVFNTNKGYVNISGAGFKDIYNQIAPGHMRIPQNGYAYFNVEKK